jgi:LDH2 family malate/lactate/ureidoglycolate dehydrogenase
VVVTPATFDVVTSDSEPEVQQLTLDEVSDLARLALLGQGASPQQATALADSMTRAERDGAAAHGLFRVAAYVAGMRTGKVDGTAVPIVNDLAPGVAQVDAGNGFAATAFQAGVEPLVSKARQNGIAVLAVTNSYHVAALWPEVEELCNRGLVGLAFVSAKAFVAPVGGTEPLFGTNPMAFGWPRSNGEHMIFDQSSSASARGRIQIRERDGKSIPEGWAIDSDGKPTTDPSAALAGAQLPFAEHKGSSMALMVELLAGALLGQMFSFEASGPEYEDLATSLGGECIIAIDPTRTALAGFGGSGDFSARAEVLFTELLKQEGTRLPSAGRYAHRARSLAEGVAVPRSLVESVTALAV